MKFLVNSNQVIFPFILLTIIAFISSRHFYSIIHTQWNRVRKFSANELVFVMTKLVSGRTQWNAPRKVR